MQHRYKLLKEILYLHLQVSKSLLRQKVKTMIEKDPKIGLTSWYIEILNGKKVW